MIKIIEKKSEFNAALNGERIVNKSLNQGLHEIGMENVTYMRKLVKQGSKTGKLYRIKGRLHRASAPGEAPANLTGSLVRSMNYKVSSPYHLEFGDEAEHGLYLEAGTRNMEKRPHIERTVIEKEKDNENSLIKAAEREFKKI